MSEMVERVAKALAKQEGYAYDPLPYDARARAAIEAMREHLVQCADRDKEQAYYAAVEEIEAALGKERKMTQKEHFERQQYPYAKPQ